MITLLDGAMGTELERRGVRTDGPGWSAGANDHAPHEIQAIHRAYASAGATVHTANTFRTTPRGLGAGWERALHEAVRLARSAVPRGHQVAGSFAPLEDCWHPERSPSDPGPEQRRIAAELASAGVDSDRLVHDVLIRYCAAFLDQGVSSWPLPDREGGFFRCFCSLYRTSASAPGWFAKLAPELDRLYRSNVDPLDSACESLHEMGVPEGSWDAYLSATFLALRGWGGMIRHVEDRPDRVARRAPAWELAVV